MWTVIYIAFDKIQAMTFQSRLSEEGILVKLRPLGFSLDSDDDGSVEILVPSSEANESKEMIAALIGEINYC